MSNPLTLCSLTNMEIFLTILIILGAIIALILIASIFMRKDYSIQREITINAPLQKVFGYIKLLRHQDNFNKWVMVDPRMKREFMGTDGTVGFVYAWNGNKRAGAGEQEIKRVIEANSIETEIRFVRPFPGIAQANMSTRSVGDNQTRVTWSNASTMIWPMNLLLPMVEKALAKDMNESLENLKRILES